MTQYPLGPLFRLRNIREDKALHALETARRRLVRAEKKLEEARNAHQRFLDWLAQEEERRYREIMETMMALDEVDDFKQGLLTLRAREAGFLEDILKAGHRVEGAGRVLVQARADLLAAQKGTMKIRVHKDLWQEDAAREAERIEEREMEDFTVSRKEFFKEGRDDDRF